MTNLYALWKTTFGPGLLKAGKVTAYDQGTATITLPGGGIIRARGAANVGDSVWVQDGVIQGPAPDLPLDSAAI